MLFTKKTFWKSSLQTHFQKEVTYVIYSLLYKPQFIKKIYNIYIYINIGIIENIIYYNQYKEKLNFSNYYSVPEPARLMGSTCAPWADTTEGFCGVIDSSGH